MTKAERTRARIRAVALDLFEQRGYEGTTVSDIAAAADVTEMTVYRHFASKDRILGDDPYDPMLARAIATRREGPAMTRALAGIRASWSSLPAEATTEVRRRLRIAGSTPALRAAVVANTAETERVVAEALRAGGTGEPEARVVAAAVLAGTMRALLDWAAGDGADLEDALERAWSALEPG